MFPKPQSGLGWPSIVVFNANSDGVVHLGKKIFGGAHTRPQNAPKIHLKPPKMAILGPNLKNDVPKTSEWARLAQYSSFQCQQRWWGPIGQKRYLGGPVRGPKIHLKPPNMAILGPNLNNDVSSHNEGLLASDPRVNDEVHFGPKNDFMGW